MYMYLRLHSMHEMRDWCFSNALGHINIYIYIFIYLFIYIHIYILELFSSIFSGEGQRQA